MVSVSKNCTKAEHSCNYNYHHFTIMYYASHLHIMYIDGNDTHLFFIDLSLVSPERAESVMPCKVM